MKAGFPPQVSLRWEPIYKALPQSPSIGQFGNFKIKLLKSQKKKINNETR